MRTAIGIGMGIGLTGGVRQTLLTQFPNAVVGYSLRKLSESTINVIKARRSLDNAELDIKPSEMLDGTLLAWVGNENLLPYSEQVEQWAGASTSMAVTQNAVNSPTGTLTADAYVPASGTFNTSVNGNFTSVIGTTYHVSAYAKNGTLNKPWIELTIAGAGEVTRRKWFDLSTGSLGSTSGTISDIAMTSVGNGWYRLSYSYVATAATATTLYISCRDADGNSSGITGNGTDPSAYVWGRQVNTASLKTYQITTANFNASNAFVTTWYDQSGNGRHAIQATAANQPRIVNAGAVETSGGKPAVRWLDAGDRLVYLDTNALDSFRTGPISSFAVAQLVTRTGPWQAIWMPTDATPNKNGSIGQQFLASSPRVFGCHNSNTTDTRPAPITLATETNRYLFTMFRDNTGVNGLNSIISQYAKNTVDTQSATGAQTWTSLTTGTGKLILGKQFDTDSDGTVATWIGSMQEIVLYGTDRSANKAAVETAINSYYSIY